MGFLQWSQRLSPHFPFALRRWSPCPRHLLSPQPVKSWLDFRLTPSSAHETRSPREGHGWRSPALRARTADPSALVPGAQQTLNRLPGSGCSRAPVEPAVPSWTRSECSLPLSPDSAAASRTHLPGELPARSLNTVPYIQSCSPGLYPSRKEACAGGCATSPRKPQGAND